MDSKQTKGNRISKRYLLLLKQIYLLTQQCCGLNCAHVEYYACRSLYEACVT